MAGCGEAAIADAVRPLTSDASLRAEMSAAGLKAVDGRGAGRIAAYISERVGSQASLRKAG
jgi:UDP-N-acetylglucosamine 2-epimerase